jgi:hypothetical protein
VAPQCVAILFDGNRFQPRPTFRTAVSQIAKVAASATATPTPMADKHQVTDAHQTTSRSSSNSASHMRALPQWRSTDTSRSGAIVSTNQSRLSVR